MAVATVEALLQVLTRQKPGPAQGRKPRMSTCTAIRLRAALTSKGYDRSTKDGTKANNWSTKGNTNPETGKAGTK
jgi:hypothetical protein